jgi:hypothetical protein
MDLFGGSQALTPHERVDGAIVNRDLNKTIKNKGGSKDVYAKSAEALSRELFDVGSEELYERTGGRKNDRSSLPKPAQKAFMVGEIKADLDLQQKDIKGEPVQRNKEIVDSVRESGKEARKWFPW